MQLCCHSGGEGWTVRVCREGNTSSSIWKQQLPPAGSRQAQGALACRCKGQRPASAPRLPALQGPWPLPPRPRSLPFSPHCPSLVVLPLGRQRERGASPLAGQEPPPPCQPVPGSGSGPGPSGAGGGTCRGRPLLRGAGGSSQASSAALQLPQPKILQGCAETQQSMARMKEGSFGQRVETRACSPRLAPKVHHCMAGEPLSVTLAVIWAPCHQGQHWDHGDGGCSNSCRK